MVIEIMKYNLNVFLRIDFISDFQPKRSFMIQVIRLVQVVCQPCRGT